MVPEQVAEAFGANLPVCPIAALDQAKALASQAVVTASAPGNGQGNLERVPLVGGAPIVDGVFAARPNQFIVEARLSDGEQIRAHCADRGRLRWLVPGTPLLLGAKDGAGRKTAFQVAAAWTENAWASLDTHLPNRFVEAALYAERLPQFSGCTAIKREAHIGHSRFDFRLGEEAKPCYVEVKSIGMARDGLALFPDAPTERGARHLVELAALAKAGVRTALIFVAQHEQAAAVLPDHRIDPQFADALQRAVEAGVEVYGYRCPITRDGITLEQEIPCLVA